MSKYIRGSFVTPQAYLRVNRTQILGLFLKMTKTLIKISIYNNGIFPQLNKQAKERRKKGTVMVWDE